MLIKYKTNKTQRYSNIYTRGQIERTVDLPFGFN